MKSLPNNCRDLRRGIWHRTGQFVLADETYMFSSAGVAQSSSLAVSLANDARVTAKTRGAAIAPAGSAYAHRGLAYSANDGLTGATCAVVEDLGCAIVDLDGALWALNATQAMASVGGGVAITSLYGTARGGEGSLLVFPYQGLDCLRYATATVGENGILPDTLYVYDTENGCIRAYWDTVGN